ncbi:serine hydrolase domain-containing protein [Streptomyces sp. NPDC002537]
MPDARPPSLLRRIRTAAGPRIAAALCIASAALATGFGPASDAQAAAAPAPVGLQKALDDIVSGGKATAALAELGANGSTTWQGTSGVSDLATRAPVRGDGMFRAGSVTKPFVATVLLQLAAEGRLRLDDPIERHLPATVTVPGAGLITVRQLLNHTGGLYEYLDDPRFDLAEEQVPRWLAVGRWQHHSPQRLVAIAVSHPPYSRPGEGFHYSNTDYVLAGTIIEKTTGHPYAEEISRRILRPLGLRHTSLPGDNPFIPGPHTHAYLKLSTGPADITEINPTVYGAAGSLISTTPDLNRFHGALLDGELLRPAERTAMMQTVGTGSPLQSYGLGLSRLNSPCGPLWGHTGEATGFQTLLLGTPDGRRHVTLSYNPYDPTQADALEQAVLAFATTALCGTH